MLISTTQRERGRGPRRAASVLVSLPSIFKCPQMYLSSRPAADLFEPPVFQQWWISCSRGCAEGGWEPAGKGVGGAVGDGRGESHAAFSPTLGVYISQTPSASDALKDQWQHTVRSNTTVLARLVNKHYFQKNVFFNIGVKWSSS